MRRAVFGTQKQVFFICRCSKRSTNDDATWKMHGNRIPVFIWYKCALKTVLIFLLWAACRSDNFPRHWRGTYPIIRAWTRDDFSLPGALAWLRDSRASPPENSRRKSLAKSRRGGFTHVNIERRKRCHIGQNKHCTQKKSMIRQLDLLPGPSQSHNKWFRLCLCAKRLRSSLLSWVLSWGQAASRCQSCVCDSQYPSTHANYTDVSIICMCVHARARVRVNSSLHAQKRKPTMPTWQN